MSDTSFQVRRPVVRTYLPKYVSNAAKHVKAGGLAVVREPRGWYLLLPCDADGDMPEVLLIELDASGDFAVKPPESRNATTA